jgi:hypothetical protein
MGASEAMTKDSLLPRTAVMIQLSGNIRDKSND